MVGTSYVTIQNLELRYGGDHGIQFLDNKNDFTVSGCDISFIGGADSYASREGNGIEIWGNAYNALIEGCNIWDCYDAGVTNQSTNNGVSQHDIIYCNNIIGDCEYSYEFWLTGTSTSMYNIYFENNTCVYAGYGWSSHQNRTNGSYGRHIEARSLYENQIWNFYIRNNIFYESTSAFLIINMADVNQSWAGRLMLDYNLYYSAFRPRRRLELGLHTVGMVLPG